MARIPGVEDLGRRPGVQAGAGIATVGNAGAIGNAVAEAGQVLGGIVEKYREEKRVADIADTDSKRLKDSLDLEQTITNDGHYDTMVPRFETSAKSIRDKYSLGISDAKTRAAWLAKAEQDDIRSAARIRDYADEGVRQQTVVKTDSALDNYSQVVANPDAPDPERAQAREAALSAIDAGEKSGQFSPAEAQRRREEYLGNADAIFALRKANRDPEAVVGQKGNYLGRLRMKESGGDDSAAAGTSSARGRYQFTDETWTGVAKAHPELELTSEGRADPAQQERAIRAFTADNEAVLKRNGVPVNDRTRYLSHFMGAGGAVTFLTTMQQDPSIPAASVFGKAAAANPTIFYNKDGSARSLGEVFDLQTKAFSDGASEIASADKPEWFSRLPPAKQYQVEQSAEAELSRRASEQQRQSNQQAYEVNGAIKLGIQTGQIATRQEIIDNPYLRDADKAERLGQLETRQKEGLAMTQAMGAIADPNRTFNPYNADDRKIADKAYEGMTQEGGQSPLDALDNIYHSKGILPPAAVNGLRGAIGSPDAATAEQGLQVASSIMVANPNAFASYDGGSDIAKSAMAFQHYTELGMSAGQAARRVSELNSPEYQRKNRVSDEDASTFVKKLGVNDVAASFGLQGSWTHTLSLGMMGDSATEIGANYEQRNAILSDYSELAEQRYRETGDEGAAKAYAKQVMSATYGVSSFDGRPVFMKFPPSKMYPPVPRVSDGVPSIDYVLDQAAAAVNAQLAPDLSPAFVAGARPAGMTSEGNIDINHRPRVTNGDGSISTVRSMSFNEDGQEILVPTVSDDGRIMSDDEAIDAYHATGRHLGKFSSPEQATAYAEHLHEQQSSAIGGVVKPADIILSPIPNVTARDWTSGRLPRYSVSYWRDDNGQRVFETVHGQAFSADPKAAEDASEAARRSDWEGKTAQAKDNLKLANPLGNQTQRDNFERTNPVRQAVKTLLPDPTGQGTPDEQRQLRDAVGGIDRESLMPDGENVDALRAKLPEAQQRILGAAIQAIASPGVDAKAITKRLRDAGIPESLWPSEVQ